MNMISAPLNVAREGNTHLGEEDAVVSLDEAVRNLVQAVLALINSLLSS